MFVDLDWPLNASSPLSASADLLVSFIGIVIAYVQITDNSHAISVVFVLFRWRRWLRLDCRQKHWHFCSSIYKQWGSNCCRQLSNEPDITVCYCDFSWNDCEQLCLFVERSSVASQLIVPVWIKLLLRHFLILHVIGQVLCCKYWLNCLE